MSFTNTPQELLVKKKGRAVVVSFHAAVRFCEVTGAIFSPNIDKMIYRVMSEGYWLGGQLGNDKQRLLGAEVTIRNETVPVTFPIISLGDGVFNVKTCLTRDHSIGNMQSANKGSKWTEQD